MYNEIKPLRIAPWTINTNIHCWYDETTMTKRASNLLAVYGPTFSAKYNKVSAISWRRRLQQQGRSQTDIKSEK